MRAVLLQKLSISKLTPFDSLTEVPKIPSRSWPQLLRAWGSASCERFRGSRRQPLVRAALVHASSITRCGPTHHSHKSGRGGFARHSSSHIETRSWLQSGALRCRPSEQVAQRAGFLVLGASLTFGPVCGSRLFEVPLTSSAGSMPCRAVSPVPTTGRLKKKRRCKRSHHRCFSRAASRLATRYGLDGGAPGVLSGSVGTKPSTLRRLG